MLHANVVPTFYQQTKLEVQQINKVRYCLDPITLPNLTNPHHPTHHTSIPQIYFHLQIITLLFYAILV